MGPRTIQRQILLLLRNCSAAAVYPLPPHYRSLLLHGIRCTPVQLHRHRAPDSDILRNDSPPLQRNSRQLLHLRSDYPSCILRYLVLHRTSEILRNSGVFCVHVPDCCRLLHDALRNRRQTEYAPDCPFITVHGSVCALTSDYGSLCGLRLYLLGIRCVSAPPQ